MSYEQKHNEANGEQNRDGENHNLSWNCGVEGPTADRAIRALRARQKRNFIATLFLSQGVPMLSGGDEVCRTQRGNNNAYCQDNEISWTHWDLDDEAREFLEFTRRASQLMRDHPVLRRRRFFQGRRIRGAGVKDIMWLAPGGHEMTEAEWNAGHVRCLGVRLDGEALDEVDDEGDPIIGDTLVYLMNAGSETVRFLLPGTPAPWQAWECLMDTFDRAREQQRWPGVTPYALADHSLAVFRLWDAAPGAKGRR